MRGEARETAERVCVWLSASGVWRLASVGSYRGDIFRMYHYIHLELVDDIFLGETRRHPIPSTRGHDTRDAEFVFAGAGTAVVLLLSPQSAPTSTVQARRCPRRSRVVPRQVRTRLFTLVV